MAGIPGIPQNFVVQTANQQNLASWSLSAGATSYIVQRSLDNVTYTLLATISGSPLATSYLDTAVTPGTQYWYQVASQTTYNITATIATGSATLTAVSPVSNLALGQVITGTGIPANTTIISINSISNTAIMSALATATGVETLSVIGTSSFTAPQSTVPVQAGEQSLGAIRLKAMQRADRVNSNFVTTSEWNSYINQSMFELYDILTTTFEDYFLAPPVGLTANGTQYIFPLPDGTLQFINPDTNTLFTPPPYYKLLGVDLALNNAANAYVTVNKYNFIDRNRFVYPNTASTIYGVFNLQYRVMGSNITFIPTPSGGQKLRLWYIPRLTELLQDTDTTYIGISGWIEYVIVKAAYYALTKEESDTSNLVMQLEALTKRIEETAANRDAGQPDTISDTNQGNWANGWNGGRNGAIGGF